jgi:hypothetical protein
VRAHREETQAASLEGPVQAVSVFAASHVRLADIAAVLIKADGGA